MISDSDPTPADRARAGGRLSRLALVPLMPYLCLALVYAIFYARHAWDLGLYVDDWGHLRMVLTVPITSLLSQWPMDYRPFDVLPWFFPANLLGQHLAGYYLLLFAVDYAAACLLYRLVLHLTGSSALGLSTAAIWALHPADSSQFWLTSIHYRLGVLFFLLSLALLLLPANRSTPRYVGAVVSCTLSLLCVELFIGLAILVPIAATLACRGRPAGPRFRRALPFLLVIGTYALYRLWLGPRVFHLYDLKGASTGGASLALVFKVEHLGFAVVLLQGWLAPLALIGRGAGLTPAIGSADVRLMFMGGLESSPDNGVIATLIFCLYAFAALLALGVHWNRARWTARWLRMRPGACLVVLGSVVVAGGLLALGDSDFASANIAGISSRLDVAADIGAALMVSGSLWIVAQWFAVSERAALFLFGTLIVAVAGLGAVQTEHTADTYAAGWTAERQLWHAVLVAAPAFKPETYVLIASTDDRSADAIAAQQPWGIDDALNLLYPGEHLQGGVLTPMAIASGCPAPGYTQFYPYFLQFGPRGLQTGADRASVIAPSRTVVLRYTTKHGGSITVAPASFAVAGGRCRVASTPDRIRNVPPPVSAWRSLMALPTD